MKLLSLALFPMKLYQTGKQGRGSLLGLLIMPFWEDGFTTHSKANIAFSSFSVSLITFFFPHKIKKDNRG
jgi:hypothetical protein